MVTIVQIDELMLNLKYDNNQKKICKSIITKDSKHAVQLIAYKHRFRC